MILPEAAPFEQTAVVQVRLPQARKRRAIPSAAVFQEREECLALNPRRSHQVIDDVKPNFIVPGYDQRPCRSRLLQFYVTSLLASAVISELFKNADQPFPRNRGQAWHPAGLSKPKGTGIGNANEPAGTEGGPSPTFATAPPVTTCHPSSRRACSKVPLSKQLTTNNSDASIRFFLASSSVRP